MSPGIESGLFAIIGAAVGAIGVALTGVVQAVSASRANRARIAAEAAAARTATRRPLYEQLISATHEARRLFVELVRDINNYQPPSKIAERAFQEIAQHIYSLVISIRIDGSEHASNIAQRLNSDMLSWLELRRGHSGYTAEEVAEMIGKVEKAEEDFTLIARLETGADTTPV
jgi:hypothetical protein